MKKMRQRLCMISILLAICSLTGCEVMEQGTTARLPMEATEGWIEEVHAKTEAEETKECIVVEPENVVVENTQPAVEGTESVQPPEYVMVPEPAATPQPESYEFTHSEKEYFSDALFIGDSRTMGLQLYGTLDNADYFATPGLSLYTIPKTKLDVGEHEDITLTELLEQEDYGKIYLMLGINELGYHFDTTMEKYQTLVNELREQEPEGILYVCANLHVTSTRHENDEIHNNNNIDKINAQIEALADNKNIFYLDVNVLFDDEEGNLNEEVASDDSHVLGIYYEDWCDWLGENTIVK